MSKRQFAARFLSGGFVFTVLLGGISAGDGAPLGSHATNNGDTNADGVIDVSDGIYLLSWLYGGGPEIAPVDCGSEILYVRNGDTNGDGAIDISDAVYLLGWLFLGRGAPAAACGPDIGDGEGAATAPRGYTFSVLARLGDPAPGGGKFSFDFEPSGINNLGDVVFGADLTTGGEGMFLRSHTGQFTAMARPGDPAPGGGTFDGFFFLRAPINDSGDLAFHFFLDPFMLPSGVNSGIYRYSHVTKTVSAVIVPGVTPAPGGGVFAGATISTSINNSGDIAFTGIVTGADIDLANPPGFNGLGNVLCVQHKDGTLERIVSPGDAAPGGRVFDIATNPWISDTGHVPSDAHLVGDTCIDFGAP